jgi:hypothetical protein
VHIGEGGTGEGRLLGAPERDAGGATPTAARRSRSSPPRTPAELTASWRSSPVPRRSSPLPREARPRVGGATAIGKALSQTAEQVATGKAQGQQRSHANELAHRYSPATSGCLTMPGRLGSRVRAERTCRAVGRTGPHNRDLPRSHQAAPAHRRGRC